MTDLYIDEAVATEMPMTIITVNGFQMHGVIIANDADSITVLFGGKKRLVFKQAISTIYPT